MYWYQKLFVCISVLLILSGCGNRDDAAEDMIPQAPYLTPLPAASSPLPVQEVVIPQPTAIPPTPTEAGVGVMPDGAVVALPPTPFGGTDETPTVSAYTTTLAMESQLLDQERTTLRKGDPAPDFSYTLTDGTTHQLSNLQGKKVLINFWATWCPPCRIEMPDIQEAFSTHRQEGFVILAVSQDTELEQIAPFVSNLQLEFPIIADPESEIARRYGVRALPMSFFINTDGTIDSWVLGTVSYRSIEERLKNMQ